MANYDNYICDAVGLVASPSENVGFGFITPKRMVVESGNGYSYTDFTEKEKIFIKSDAFAHHKNILSNEKYKSLCKGDILIFKLYNGGRGLYATDIKKIDSIFDEDGYIKDVSIYGISNIN